MEYSYLKSPVYVALEKDHGGTWDVLGIEKSELDI